MNNDSVLRKTLCRVNKTANFVFLSPVFGVLLFIAACCVPVFDLEVIAAVAMVLLISVIFVLCDDIMAVVLPIMLLCVFVTKCYNSFTTFMAYVWVAAPLISALIFHFTVYRRKIKIGPTFTGICAVAVAVTLGGLGTISSGEYFKGTTLYYTVFLGIGMVGLYLLMKSQFLQKKTYDIKQRFSVLMTVMGLYACFCIAVFFVKGWDLLIENRVFPSFQSSNNLATMIMIAMPFSAMMSLKKKRWLPLLFIYYIFLIMAGSRGGILMGGIEFALCILYIAVFDKKYRYIYIIAGILFSVGILFCLPYILHALWLFTNIEYKDISIIEYIKRVLDTQISTPEVRTKLFERAWECFKTNIIFGTGIGYSGNSDVYNPVAGAMNWYHMWLPQIVGSMGIVGIIAYFGQFIQRIIVTAKKGGQVNWGFFMSYLGLFLMSQVNPGEFCPIPYALSAVLIFIFIELPVQNDKKLTAACDTEKSL